MKKKYKDLFRKAKQSPDYWEEVFNLELTEDIWKIMKNRRISQKKLSSLLGTSEAYVSKILNGNQNLSIKSISKLAFVLGSAPHIHIAPIDAIVEWKERSSSDSRTEISLPSGSYYTGSFEVDYKINQPEVFIWKGQIPEPSRETPSRWEVN